MAEDKLLTASDFDRLVRSWGDEIRALSRSTLQANTHGTNELSNELAYYADKDRKTHITYKVKFNFNRYGVFLSYGVGAGYIHINGQVVRGYRVRTTRDIKNKVFGTIAGEMLKKGYTVKEVNKAKIYDKMHPLSSLVERHPLDWIDGHIEAHINQLADYVQDFYGDEALRQVLKNFKNMKINKSNG